MIQRTPRRTFKIKKITTSEDGTIKQVKVSEATVLAHILGYLLHNDYFYTRLNSGGVYTMQRRYVRLAPAGWPDIIGIMNDGSGRFFGIEVKAQGGYQNPEQKRIQQQMVGKNGIYIVARSISEVIEKLEGKND